MAPQLHLDYRRRPAAWRFMARALRPSPGFGEGQSLPALGARWLQHRVDGRELADFAALSGLRDPAAVALLYPHTITFPLHMVVLTHPAFPVPIWRLLQVRNRLLQHRPLDTDAPMDLAVATHGCRILDKGAEIDLHATVCSAGELVWESVNTFYVRGRFGAPGQTRVPAAPEVGGTRVAQWLMPRGGGRRFGALSGDYNGIHLFGWYARRLGFRRAFFHPQRVLGHCLERLPGRACATPLALETWLKGPVYYGVQVALRAEERQGAVHFALDVDGDARPAIVGCLRRDEAGMGLTGQRQEI
jgi:hypothetical protein